MIWHGINQVFRGGQLHRSTTSLLFLRSIANTSFNNVSELPVCKVSFDGLSHGKDSVRSNSTFGEVLLLDLVWE